MKTLLFFGLLLELSWIVVHGLPTDTGMENRADSDTTADCATNEGRAGSCSIKSSCGYPDFNSLPVCSSFFPFITTVCCPFNNDPGVPFRNYPGCGLRPEISPIVGGYDSVPNSWPWAVVIYQRSTRDPSKKQMICGGSIINEQYILSAAHCVVRYEGTMKANDFFVKVGGHDITSSGKFYDVAAVIPHENYRNYRRYNDIALFKLAQKLDFTDPAVGPVCLPTPDMQNMNMTGQKAAVIGWGTTSFGGDVSRTLKEVDVTMLSNEMCDQAYRSVEGAAMAYPQGITQNFICAGEEEGGKDSCQGDSGGPLLWNYLNRWWQTGLVSFGYKCAEPNFPGVYTRTSEFLKWVGSHTETTKRGSKKRPSRFDFK